MLTDAQRNRLAAQDAWAVFIAAARRYAPYLDQFEKVRFDSPGSGTIYLTISQSDPHPDSFDDLDAPST